jgi:hypothetical protein
MSNSINIIYNGADAFRGLCPTPFISVSQDFIDYGNDWNQVTNLTLNGQLISGGSSSTNSNFSFHNSIGDLVRRFNQNYKIIQIKENNTTLFQGMAIIDSIVIDENSWYGSIPFNINLSVYEENFFTNYYGIVEPSEEISFTEEDGDYVSLTHKISAKGLVTENKKPLENAKSWVIQRTGNINRKITPIFIKDNQKNNYLLQSTKEVVDRFNGVFSWEAIYKKNINIESPSNAFLDYSIDISSGIQDSFILLQIDGNLKGNSLNVLKNEFDKLDLFKICNKTSLEIAKTNISSRPIKQSISNNEYSNTLTFNYSFNNDFSNDIINNYTVDINFDELKCDTSVILNATISCKYGDSKTKWDKVKTFYNNNFDPQLLARREYSKEIPNKILNKNPITESIKYDEFNSEITYSAEYNDKRNSFNDDVLSLTSQVTLTPSINIHIPNTSVYTPREHNIQNLNCANRTMLDISVSAIAKNNKNISAATLAANGEISRIKTNYIGSQAFTEDRQININNTSKTVSINEKLTYQGPVIT